MKLSWLATTLMLASVGATEAVADSYVVPAAVDFSVRDEGRDGFDQVLEGECCIRATIFTTFRIRGAAEFDLSSLPPGLVITAVTLRLILVSGTGDNPADFFAYAADGVAGAEDGERTDVLLLSNFLVSLSVLDISHPALTSLVQTRYGQASYVGILFKLTREDELSFHDLEFAANPGNPNIARLVIEAVPAPAPPPEVSPPGAAVPLTVETAGPGLLALEWELTAGCDTYRIITGEMTSLVPSGGVTPINSAPIACGISGTTTEIPEPSASIFLLVAGENAGGIGPLGSGAPGIRNADPACP